MRQLESGLSREAGVVTRSAGYFEDIARSATRNPDSPIVVLGKFSRDGGVSYQKVAAHYRASYFKVENWNEITKGMTEAEKWKLNEAFLMQQLSAGKQIILSQDPKIATGFFAEEVKYLERLGYHFQKEGWVWRAVKDE
jgi:hypothetical protein